MGYELTHFVGEVDKEFLCSICTSVLEDPVQTTCEHSFCSACIKDWLSTIESCPTDLKPLTATDLRPSSRPFRNLWKKLDIKCDFQPDGCSAIIKLENLTTHVGSCEDNLNSEIVCDKGCNMTITRREYQINNCFTHLANAQEKVISKLKDELSDQKEHFVRIVNGLQDELNGQQAEIRKLNGLQDENRKLNDEVSRLRSQLENFESAMSRQQQQQTAELSDKSNIPLRPLKWRRCENVEIEESNILKLDNPWRGGGAVISEYPLEPGKSSFKVHVLGIGGHNEAIGLKSDSLDWSINYYNDGDIYVNGAEWQVGDIIECGIKFPDNFINDGNHSATVHFSRNEELIYEKSLTIPKNGLFPRICIYGKETKLKYFH